MAMAEDAASVLEQFVQDGISYPQKSVKPCSNFSHTVANLPAEIHHLLEEIAAKDRVVEECKSQITTRDGSIQKFVKTSGAGQPNPKEEGYCKAVMTQYDRAQVIQEEKVGLSEKAALLVRLCPPVFTLPPVLTIIPA